MMMKQTVIKKAVFPVAGLGTRFLPATKASPKEMLTIVDKPLIQYAVEEAAAAAQSLQDQAGELAKVVSIFKLSANETAFANRSAPVSRRVEPVAVPKSKPKTSLKSLPAAKPAPKKAATATKASDDDWEEF